MTEFEYCIEFISQLTVNERIHIIHIHIYIYIHTVMYTYMHAFM